MCAGKNGTVNFEGLKASIPTGQPKSHLIAAATTFPLRMMFHYAFPPERSRSMAALVSSDQFREAEQPAAPVMGSTFLPPHPPDAPAERAA